MDDHRALSELVGRLGRWLDDGSPGDGRGLFTDDAEVRTPGGTASGLDALVAQARRNHAVPTQHFITDPLIEVDGDRATIHANHLVAFVPEGGLRLTGGRYELEAARTPNGWRLTRVQARPVWEAADV